MRNEMASNKSNLFNNSIDNMGISLSQLDKIVTQRAQSMGNILPPLLNSTSPSDGNGMANGNGQQPISINMHVVTPDANSFRMSQGQLMAEAAAAIMRATRRNV